MYDLDEILDTNNERLQSDRTYIVDKNGNLVRKKRHRTRTSDDRVKLPSVPGGGQFRCPARSGGVDLAAPDNSRRRERVNDPAQKDFTGSWLTGKNSDGKATMPMDVNVTTNYIDPICSPSATMYTRNGPAPQTPPVCVPPTGNQDVTNQTYNRSRRRIKHRPQEQMILDGDSVIHEMARMEKQVSPVDVYIEGIPVERDLEDGLDLSKPTLSKHAWRERRNSPLDVYIDSVPVDRCLEKVPCRSKPSVKKQPWLESRCTSVDGLIAGIPLDRELEETLETKKRISDLEERIKNLTGEHSEFRTYAVRHKHVDDTLGELLNGIDDILTKDKPMDYSSKTTGDCFQNMGTKPKPINNLAYKYGSHEIVENTPIKTRSGSQASHFLTRVSPITEFKDDLESEIQDAIATQKRFTALNEKVKKFQDACREKSGNTGHNRRKLIKADQVDDFLNDLDDTLKTPMPEKDTQIGHGLDYTASIDVNTRTNDSARIATRFSNTHITPRMTSEPRKQWNGQTAKRGVGFKSKLKKEESKVKNVVDDLIPEKIRKDMNKRFS